MERRKFLVGMGGTAVGASALIGSGAFSRVESQRAMRIAVAEDSDAYLGLKQGSSESADNYVEEDENGHLEVDIGENPNEGEGVNSNSLTFFDNMIEVCNQGKEDAHVYVDFEADHGAIDFYTGEAQGSQGDEGITLGGTADDPLAVDVGECREVGIRVDTGKGDADTVDATEVSELIDGDVTVIADVDLDD